MRKPRNNKEEPGYIASLERLKIDYVMEGESSREYHYMLFYNKDDFEKSLEWLMHLMVSKLVAGFSVSGTESFKITMNEYQKDRFKTWASDNGIVVRFFSRITAMDEQDSFVMKKARIPRGTYE